MLTIKKHGESTNLSWQNNASLFLFFVNTHTKIPIFLLHRRDRFVLCRVLLPSEETPGIGLGPADDVCGFCVG